MPVTAFGDGLALWGRQSLKGRVAQYQAAKPKLRSDGSGRVLWTFEQQPLGCPRSISCGWPRRDHKGAGTPRVGTSVDGCPGLGVGPAAIAQIFTQRLQILTSQAPGFRASSLEVST